MPLNTAVRVCGANDVCFCVFITKKSGTKNERRGGKSKKRGTNRKATKCHSLIIELICVFSRNIWTCKSKIKRNSKKKNTEQNMRDYVFMLIFVPLLNRMMREKINARKNWFRILF